MEKIVSLQLYLLLLAREASQSMTKHTDILKIELTDWSLKMLAKPLILNKVFG